MILKQLGVFGWKEADENLVLASLLTGDPLLLIGNHLGGTFAFGKPSRWYAKTHVANKVARALGRRFLVYGARGAPVGNCASLWYTSWVCELDVRLSSTGNGTLPGHVRRRAGVGRNGDSPVSLRSLGTVPVFQLKHGVVEYVLRFLRSLELSVRLSETNRTFRPSETGGTAFAGVP